MLTDFGNLTKKAQKGTTNIYFQGAVIPGGRQEFYEALTDRTAALQELPKVSGDHQAAALFLDNVKQARQDFGQLISADTAAPRTSSSLDSEAVVALAAAVPNDPGRGPPRGTLGNYTPGG